MAVPRGLERANHQGLLPVPLHGALAAILVLVGVGAAGCSDDPVYLSSTPPELDFTPNNDPDAGPAATLELKVPIDMPTAEDDAKRMAIATANGLTLDQVPKARRDDTDLELEWSIKNPGMDDATAILVINGANEFFRYDNSIIPVGEEEPAPPALAGGRPIAIPAGGTVSGVVREDEMSDAAQDLDAMTRAGYNYTKALITRWSTKDISGGMGGMLDVIPSAAVPLLLDLRLNVTSNRELILTANLRARDRSGRLAPTETDATRLVPASDTMFLPPPPPVEAP